MKLKKVFLCLMVLCLTILPTSVALGSTSGVSGKLNPTYTTKGTISAGNALTSISPDSAGGAYGQGAYGSDFFQFIAIGSNLVDGDWRLASTSGPITFVNTVVWFDDGQYKTFKYPCAYTVQSNSAQVSMTSGYHTATFEGTGTINLLYDFSVTPLKDGDTVY